MHQLSVNGSEQVLPKTNEKKKKKQNQNSQYDIFWPHIMFLLKYTPSILQDVFKFVEGVAVY